MRASFHLPNLPERQCSSVVVDNARSHFISLAIGHGGKEGEDLPPLCFYRETKRKSKKAVSPKMFDNRSKSFLSSEKQSDEIICRWDSMPSSSSSSASSIAARRNSISNTASARGRDTAPIRRTRSSDDALALAAAGCEHGLELDEIFLSESKVDQEPRRPRRRNSDSFTTLDRNLIESLSEL